MSEWVTIQVGAYKPEPYKFEPHSPKKVKFLPWSVCTCGLIYLRNELTAWCVSKGCNYDAHPQYKAAAATANPFKART